VRDRIDERTSTTRNSSPELLRYPAGRPDPGLKQNARASIKPSTIHLAAIAGLELLVIDGDTSIHQFEKELRWNELDFRLRRRL
jgi:hypothetical protein